MNVILNEKNYIEDILRDPYLPNKPSELLSRVARYYHHHGYNKSKIEELLKDFLIKSDPMINIVRFQPLIDKIVANAGKYELIQIDGVSITHNEIHYIQNIKSIRARRVMFTLLCLAKYSNAINKKNNNWVNKTDKEIFKLSNTMISTNNQSLILNDLYTNGYIKFSHIIDNMNIRIENVDYDGEEAIFITDFRNLGNQYMRYIGGDYMECSCCGLVIKRTGRTQKYCKDCAVDMNRNKTIERYYNKHIITI